MSVRLSVSTSMTVAALAVSAPAFAAPFTALTCPAYPSYQQIPATYSTWELTQQWSGSAYGNNISHQRRIFANKNVTRVYLKWSSFFIEDGYDYLYTARDLAPWWEWGQFTGSVNTAPFYMTSLTQNAQTQPLWTRFTTDGSIGTSGFALEKIGVSCASNPYNWTGSLGAGTRAMGVLLGSNDSVTVNIPAPNNSAPGGARGTNFILWSDTPGVDVDLYVRCNAVPTTDTYTYRGFSSDAQEFIRAPSSSCPSGGTWYVTVHSYSGASHFNLMASYSLDSWAVSAGVKVLSTDDAVVSATAEMVRGAYRQTFGFTEGGFLFSHFDVCASDNSAACDAATYKVTRRFDCDRSSANCLYNTVTLCTDASATTLAHEFGHMPLCLKDEYQEINEEVFSQCGHSMMGTTPWWLRNVCYSTNHNLDPEWPAVPSVWQNAWYYITGSNGAQPPKVPPELYPSSTPDNTGYENHDFNGAIPIYQHF